MPPEEEDAGNPPPESTPAPEEEAQTGGVEIDDGKSPAKPSSGLAGSKILVVDDTRPMRMLEAKALVSCGAAVEEAANGRDALELLRAAHGRGEPFTLVLMDLMMPVLDGYKTLQHIRSDPDLEKIPVVIVTTRGERESLVNCAKYGISSYLLKPFKTAHLLEVAEKAASAGEFRKAKSLSSKHVKELRELLVRVARDVVEAKLVNVATPEEEPVSRAVREFLDKHCPE